MFISKARHESEIKRLGEVYQSRITGLEFLIKSQEERIQDLRSLVFSPARAGDVPPVMVEADQILTPTNDSPILDTSREEEDWLRERDRIFSGEYEQVSE